MTLIKNILTFFFAGIIVFANSAFYPHTQPDVQEYTLKAAFIARFADYIDWANEGDNSTFTIGVLGESAIVGPLNDIAKDKKVKNKNIIIKICKTLDDINSCQVVFVSKNYTGTVESVAAKANNSPVLIITEQK